VRNIGVLLGQVVDVDDIEPSFEFVEFSFRDESVESSDELETIDGGDDEEFVLGLDTDAVLFIL